MSLRRTLDVPIVEDQEQRWHGFDTLHPREPMQALHPMTAAPINRDRRARTHTQQHKTPLSRVGMAWSRMPSRMPTTVTSNSGIEARSQTSSNGTPRTLVRSRGRHGSVFTLTPPFLAASRYWLTSVHERASEDVKTSDELPDVQKPTDTDRLNSDLPSRCPLQA